jgi:epsin
LIGEHTLTARQALTLLEYLVKHGSERVVDDARAHISTIKMLRSFHYIDEKGKDQGINGEYTSQR